MKYLAPFLFLILFTAPVAAQVFQGATPGLFQQTAVESSFLAALPGAPQFVTFDELPTGSLSSTQYASIGLTTNTAPPVPPLFAGDAVLDVIATGPNGAAHSGTKYVSTVTTFAVAESFTLSFSLGLSAVSFWICDQEINAGATDRIKVFDINGVQLVNVSNLSNGYTGVELGVQGNMFFGYITTGALIGSVRIIESTTDNDGIGLDDIRFVVASPATYPGTGDGLVLATSVGSAPFSVAPFDVKTAGQGDLIQFQTTALNAAFYGAPVIFGVELFSTGGTAPSAAGLGLPMIHLSITPSTVFVVGGPGSFLTPVLPSSGLNFAFLAPPGLSGLSLEVQSFIGSPAAQNGFFAASDAHEIRFL